MMKSNNLGKALSMHQTPDYLAELALIEVSRQQREALKLVQWKPKKDNSLLVVLRKMKDQ